jgi:hypothetical protein
MCALPEACEAMAAAAVVAQVAAAWPDTRRDASKRVLRLARSAALAAHDALTMGDRAEACPFAFTAPGADGDSAALGAAQSSSAASSASSSSSLSAASRKRPRGKEPTAIKAHASSFSEQPSLSLAAGAADGGGGVRAMWNMTGAAAARQCAGAAGGPAAYARAACRVVAICAAHYGATMRPFAIEIADRVSAVAFLSPAGEHWEAAGAEARRALRLLAEAGAVKDGWGAELRGISGTFGRVVDAVVGESEAAVRQQAASRSTATVHMADTSNDAPRVAAAGTAPLHHRIQASQLRDYQLGPLARRIALYVRDELTLASSLRTAPELAQVVADELVPHAIRAISARSTTQPGRFVRAFFFFFFFFCFS